MRQAIPPRALANLPQKLLPLVRDYKDCWLWPGPLGRDGYGRWNNKGYSLPAHVAVYALLREAPLVDKEIHHRCFRRSCVNPFHLIELTRSEHRRAHSCVGP